MPDADLTITASWTPILYTITWLNEDGSLIETTQVAYDVKPTHDTPSKPSDVQYDYIFTGWTPTIVVVTGDATYKATFNDHTIRSYSIRWENKDGSELKTDVQPYGTQLSYTGIPTYSDGTGKLYSFRGWKCQSTGEEYTSEDVLYLYVGGEETYTAQYDVINHLDVASEQTIAVNATVETTTVHVAGNLTITPDNTLTTTDLILEGTPNTSGQITGAGTLTATRAYFHFSNGTEGFKAKTWYAVAVPWQVDVPANVAGGVYFKKGTGAYVQQKLGKTYDLIYYDGARRATGANKAWQYVEDDAAAYHVMVPGRAYMIYLATDADTIRFERKEGAALHTNSLETKKYEVSQGLNGTYADWNGIANPATYHAYLNVGATENRGQIYVAETKQYELFDMSEHKLVVGQPIFVQPLEETTIMANASSNDYSPVLAPSRNKEQTSLERYELYLAPSLDEATDRIIVRMDEEKEENAYMVGQDLVKMGVSSVVPQMWVERYDSKMCINTVAPNNEIADYPLGISVPQDGEYDIFLDDEPSGESTLYLTYDNVAIWNLSSGAYIATLNKGTNNHYGLRIVVKAPQITTGIEETTIQNGEEIRKVLVDDKIYIIRNGEIYSIDGRLVNE